MELVVQSRVVVAEAWGQFGNPEKGERPPLEAATKQRDKWCQKWLDWKVNWIVMPYV
jgi:hypothetical protein